jgi:hypothetical protein
MADPKCKHTKTKKYRAAKAGVVYFLVCENVMCRKVLKEMKVIKGGK